VDFKKLFSMQKELDAHIQENHELQGENLVNKKILALLVELGELANETRCFKFWSLKPPAPTEKILEEYVDGIHFILSIGIEHGYENQRIHKFEHNQVSLTEQFLKVFGCVSSYKQSCTFQDYETLFQDYLVLGELLGFTEDAIEQAYILKNEVNYERQEQGY
jgi:dimeric dUTPase (all-alpha-NTP-PPase superfamily)